MIQVIAYELRFIQGDPGSIKKVGVDLKLPDIENFKLVLPGLNVLPIEDSLLEEVVEGVTQFDI